MSDNKTLKRPRWLHSAGRPSASELPPAIPTTSTRRGIISLRVKSGVNLVVLVLAVVIVGVAGGLGLNELNYQVDNLYNFMLIPIYTLDGANLAQVAAQESFARIAGGQLSREEIEAEVSQIRNHTAKMQDFLQRYDNEWVTTTSPAFTQVLERNGQLSLQVDEVATLAQLHSAFDEYSSLRDPVLQGTLDGQPDLAEIRRLDEASRQVQDQMDRLAGINLKFAQVSFDDAVAAHRTSSIAMIATGVVVTLLGIGLVFVLMQSIRRPLSALQEAAGKVSAGQLDVAARVFTRDEIGVVATAFNAMIARLREMVGSLETRVAARTRDLALASEVGRNLSQVRDLDTLLANAVELIRLRFDLYYAQMYLPDSEGRLMVLRAGTGEVGLELLRRNHRLPISPGSLNGRAATERRAVIVADTTQSATFKPNPLLPDTRSEMAVPLLVGDRVVGVLDLQSAQMGALSEENLPGFEALAGQLAVAIDNARLFAEAEQARAEVARQAGRLTREGWQAFLDAVNRSERLGYTFDHQALTPLTEPLPEKPGVSTLDVPVTVTGEAIGRIQLERDADKGEAWTEDDAELVTAIAVRVANQIENLRLLVQAEQYRTEAEAMTRRLTREGWEHFLRSRAAPVAGYTYDSVRVTPLSAASNDAEPAALRLSLQVQDESIGEVGIAGVENLDPALEKMAAMIVQQLSTHIENLRLSEQVQARAQREQILSDITARVHSAVDADAIMRTAVQEIGRALGRRAFIYLGDGDRAKPPAPEGVPAGGQPRPTAIGPTSTSGSDRHE